MPVLLGLLQIVRKLTIEKLANDIFWLYTQLELASAEVCTY